MADATIHIGPAGWSYPDWRGLVYPQKRPPHFSELEFISHYFTTAEINTTFYRLPLPEHAHQWLEKVKHRSNFTFCVKLWQGFTHSDADLALDPFKDVLALIAEANRLGAVLIQFPWRFKRSTENEQRLFSIADALSEFPLAVEFRHGSWQNDAVVQELRHRRISFVNIDQPVINDSVKPSSIVTSPIGYVRLHGRNEAAWFAEDADRNMRYNYLYKEQELKSWLPRIKQMAKQVETMYVIFNNHYRGQALINAFQLLYELKGKKPLAPSELLQHYPMAGNFAEPDLRGRTMSLF